MQDKKSFGLLRNNKCSMVLRSKDWFILLVWSYFFSVRERNKVAFLFNVTLIPLVSPKRWRRWSHSSSALPSLTSPRAARSRPTSTWTWTPRVFGRCWPTPRAITLLRWTPRGERREEESWWTETVDVGTVCLSCRGYQRLCCASPHRYGMSPFF